MTQFDVEDPKLHDASAGQPAVPAGRMEALPTPSSPGYTFFQDYKGNHWTCCVCMKEWLTLFQQVALHRGMIKQGLDVWQLTGGASASAGTHSQGGAFDLLFQTTDDWVALARNFGATATWRRTTAQGFSAQHMHGVLNGCPHNQPAAYQVVAQKAGYDGLGYLGEGGKDYHAAPNPYTTWNVGVMNMKRELGLLALPSTTTLLISPTTVSKGSFSLVRAETHQGGAAYVNGYHYFDWLNGSTWQQFAKAPVMLGASSLYWAFMGTNPIRCRFLPSNAQVTQPSISNAVNVSVVDVAALQKQITDLKTQLGTK